MITKQLDLIYKLKKDIRLLRNESRDLIYSFLVGDCSKEFSNIRDKIDNLVFLEPDQKAQLINLVEGYKSTNKDYDNRVFNWRRYHALLCLKRTLIYTQVKMICIMCNLLNAKQFK